MTRCIVNISKYGIIFLLVIVCCFPFSGSAQDGPLGIGNSDGSELPPGYSQPRLLLWLDGSSLQTSGSSVISWQDKSGNDHHFTPETASNRPLYEGSSGPESTPCAVFDGIDDRLVCPDFELTSNGYTIYFVVRTSDTKYGLFSYATPSEPFETVIQNDNGIKQQIRTNIRNSQIADLSNNSWQYGGIYWDPVGSRLWEYDRTSQANYEDNNSFGNGLTLSPTGNAVLGDIQQVVNGGYIAGDAFAGRIAEIIIWEGHMTRPIARMMRTYLWTKYGNLDGNPGAWDKFQGRASGSNGEYYNPVCVGRDNGTNSGEHCESHLNGLVLRVNPGQWTASRAYMCAGQVPDAGNSIVTTNLPAGVEARWNRVWEIGSTDDGNQVFRIGFDFSEGINGDIPQVPENFVLLRRTGNSGTFGIFPSSQITEVSIVDDQVVFTIPGQHIDEANRFFTVGTTNAAVSSLDGSTTRTWYAYQTGTWSSPTTWTLDGSAAPIYLNPSNSIPAPNDNIFIGSGRTVTVNVNGLTQGNLSVFGTLNVGTASQPTFLSISGSGTIRCAGNNGSGNFPIGSTSSFADPISGGSVEFYGTGGFVITNNLELNRVSINLSSASASLTMAANFSHNGLFEINRGTLVINNADDISRIFTSNGDVLVESQGRISMNPGGVDTDHTWNFYKNFTNLGGQVRFTRRTSPNYSASETAQWVNARFISSVANQLVQANGITYFSRIVINKGTDMTYTLTMAANGANKFALYGRCNDNFDGAFTNENANSNSCALINGTLEVKEFIYIPLHVSSGNYCINETAMLWINGGEVVKGPPLAGGSTAQALVPYGIVKLSAGILRANVTSGITTRDNGVLQVDGGQLFTNQIRTSVNGPENIGGLIINGGTVLVDGTNPGGTNGSYYTFSLTYPGNIFRMTGGILRVMGPSGKGLIFINSDPEQTFVSGGTVIAEVKNNSSNHKVTSRVPFWNFEVRRSDVSVNNRPVFISEGESFGEIITDQPLIIKNNLRIIGANSPMLRMVSSSGLPVDAYVGGDLTIQNGAYYDHNLNTTYFDGNSNSILSLPTTAPAQTFNNVVVAKSSSTRFAELVAGNSTRAMDVLGDFRVETGYFVNNGLHVSLKGNLVNRSIIGSETSMGIIYVEGPSAQTITSQTGVFHNLTINNLNGVTLQNDGITVRRQMRILNGNFFIQNFKVSVEGVNGTLSLTGPSAARCFVTDGSASAGGLELVYNSLGNKIFPLGVLDGTIVKYRPAQVQVNNDFVDPCLIRVTPVDTLLNTVNLSGGTDYLNFYWKVSYADFENIPRISHRFDYQDEDVIGVEANLASGRVLTQLPFTRSVDSLSVSTDHINTTANYIFFNGPLNAQTMTGAGTELVNASYTAGNWQRFTGSPEVYFSRSTSFEASWNNSANWNSLDLFVPGDGPHQWHSSTFGPASDYPQEGDIVFIGFDPATLKPHVYASDNNVNVAQVNFTPLQDTNGNRQPRYVPSVALDAAILRPALSFSSNAQINKIGEIQGEGAIIVGPSSSTPIDLKSTDIGGFLEEDSSIVIIRSATPSYQFASFPAEVPNLFLIPNGSGSVIRNISFVPSVKVRRDLEIVGAARVVLNTGITGDLTIGGNLILARYQTSASTSGQLLFQSSGSPRRVEVGGDLRLYDTGSLVAVSGANNVLPLVLHNFTLSGNIIQNAPGSTPINFFTTSSSFDNIVLTLRGSGSHSFINTAGNAPRLGRLIVDKGINTNSSFSFDFDVDILGSSGTAQKAVELRNGLLKFNHPDISVNLSSGGGDFVIPQQAGLELNQGNLTINGVETGLLLDGLLRITGGDFIIGEDITENNYIEYSSSGQAAIDISGGNLIVGTQIRRGLTNVAGILDYRQSGGGVTVGVYGAPAANRGVFEVTNTGSRFDFTDGTLTVVRGINSTSTPSILLEPAIFNTEGNAQLIIGASNSPSAGNIQNIGIKSIVPISTIKINNDSGNNPIVKLYTSPLTVRNLLDISVGSTFNSQVFDLTVQGDILNNGTLIASSGTVNLEHAVVGDISGSGSFQLFNLNRSGGLGSLTTVNANLQIANNYNQDSGTVDFGSNSLSVGGDATIDGSLSFDASGSSLIFNGTGSQTLSRTGPGLTEIGSITIDNSSGVDMTGGTGYIISLSNNLNLKSGVFNLSGNLLVLGENSEVIGLNPFGEFNMIRTEGAFANFGVQKFVAANSVEDIFLPLGIDRFMPVRLNFSDPGFSSGNTVSNYLVRLTSGVHPVITNDSESPDPEIVDALNVLGMYFTLDAENVGAGFEMIAEFQYDDDYVNVTSGNIEEEYFGARIVDGSPSPSINKFPTAVDPVNNIIRFEFNNSDDATIDGEYFAGIENAIPNFVPVYQTMRDGSVSEGQAPPIGVYDLEVPGNGAPSGAVVVIRDTDELVLGINGVNFYKTVIGDSATLTIDATSFHRLGRVEGTGTIKLIGTGNLPNGTYNEFFTCTGGKLIFEGRLGDEYDILANLPIVRKVDVIGLGLLTVANNDVDICEDFTVSGPVLNLPGNANFNVGGNTLVTSGTVNFRQSDLTVEGDFNTSGASIIQAGNSGTTTIVGNLNLNGAAFSLGSFKRETHLKRNLVKNDGSITGGTGGAPLVFSGDSTQSISGLFTGSSNRIPFLRVDNSSGINLLDPLEVVDTLSLINGNIRTSPGNELILQNDGLDIVPLGGSHSSFVDGPVSWNLLGPSGPRIFPTGKNDRFRPVSLADRSASRLWTVEYYDTIATVQPSIPNVDPLDPAIIKKVSIQEHWRINSNTGATTTAKVGLSWGENSAVAPDPNDYDKLVVMAYDVGSTSWVSEGGQDFNYDGGMDQGSFIAESNTSFTERFFTLGSRDAINPLPVTWLYFSGETNGEHHTLKWATASEVDNDYFEIERSIDAYEWFPLSQVQGAGNSNSTLHYTFVDRTAPFGRVYYRIKQVDFDGKFEYASNVVTLVKELIGDHGSLDFLIYPNPSRNVPIRFMLSEFAGAAAFVTFSDLSGKTITGDVIWVNEQGVSDEIQCNFEPGIYLVTVVINDKTRSKPLVITK